MPQFIRTIDEIAREKQRDVIFIQFHNFNTGFVSDYRTNASRKAIIKWLEKNNVSYTPCGGFDTGSIVEGYGAEIYVDILIDENDSNFFKLVELFSSEGGGRRFDDAWLFYLLLAVAMLNADEEGENDSHGLW